MRGVHVSAVCAALLACACGRSDPADHVRAVRLHALAGCAPGSGNVTLVALGDFDPSPTTAELFSSAQRGRSLGFPEATRAVQAKLDDHGASWLGIAGEQTDGGDFDATLWPASATCALSGAASGYPAGAGGQALGVSRDGRTLLVAGGATASSASAGALVFDTGTGAATEVPDGMVPGRAFATVTAFGDDLLVAGGLDPRTGGAAQGTAIVYSVASGRFDRTALVPLSTARAHHAAVVLPSGETLLVGGVDASGAALATLDAISPADRAPREIGLATLAVARVDPVALRLDNGRILVGGGTDGAGAAVDRVEYLSEDASSLSFALVTVPARYGRAFVAMPGGAALAVGGCTTRACTCSAPGDCRDAWWLSPDGVAERLPDLPVDGVAPMLVTASDGAPWLFAGPPGARSALRFDPWQGRFLAPPAAPAPAPPADLPAPVAIDGGAFAWLAHDGSALSLDGFRSGTRGPFAFDVAPLLATLPPEGTFPESQAAHVAPDRAPLRAGAGVRFDAATGLHLSGDVATASVTDARYLTLSVKIALASGPPPIVVLGDRAYGTGACAWPDGAGGALALHVTLGTVTLERGGATTTCSGPVQRFSLGFRAGPAPGETVLRSVEIRRSAGD